MFICVFCGAYLSAASFGAMYFAETFSVVYSIGYNYLTGEENIVQSLVFLYAIGEIGAVDDFVGIKNADICIVPFTDHAFSAEIVYVGGERCHFSDHFGKGSNVFLAYVPTEGTREGGLQSGMEYRLAAGHARIGADHSTGMGQNRPDILFAHGERACLTYVSAVTDQIEYRIIIIASA